MITASRTRAWLARFLPVRTALGTRERLASFVGALLGLFVTGFVARAWLGSSEQVPLLIAPMGASTVLVFGVPASPLAQPWSVIGGNIIAAFIGIAALRSLTDPVAAGAVAVAATILITGLLGCLHPPAGAVALTAVIGGPVIAAAGYRFALVPVALNSVSLVLMGLLFNNLAGRSYPHAAALPVTPHRTTDAPPEFRLGFSAKDIDAALTQLGTPLDVERDDLLALFRQVEEAAHRRLHGVISCADIMSRDLVTARPGDTPERALALLREHALRVLPVVDEAGRVLAAVDAATVAGASVASMGELPSVHFELATEGTPVEELLPLLSRGHVLEALIVDDARRLVGVVTQTDLLAVLGRARLAQASSPSELAAALRALKTLPAKGRGRRSH